VRVADPLQRRDEIARVSLRALGREQDLEAAVLPDVELARVEAPGLGLQTGCQLSQVARVAGEHPRAGLEDDVVRCLAAVFHPSADLVLLASVDRCIEVDGVRVVDGGPVDDRERVAEVRTHRVFVERPLDGAVHEAHQVAVAFGEVARVLRRGHQIALVDRVTSALQVLDHLVPGGAQVLLRIGHHASP